MDLVPEMHTTFTAIDIETTGLHPFYSEIIEIAAVKFQLDGTFEDDFTQLINPLKPIPPRATEIHGITDSMVAGKPLWGDVAPYLYKFVGDSVLVAHNAPFDLSFLTFKGTVIQNPFPDHFVADTLTIARGVYRHFAKFTLLDLSGKLGFEMTETHRALADAKACAELFLAAYNTNGIPWEEFADNFIFHTAAWQTLENIDERMMPLVNICRDGIDVQIVYIDSEGVVTTRRVTPIQLNRIRQIPYLFGHCHLRNAGRNFRLDRIHSWKPLNKS